MMHRNTGQKIACVAGVERGRGQGGRRKRGGGLGRERETGQTKKAGNSIFCSLEGNGEREEGKELSLFPIPLPFPPLHIPYSYAG